MKIVILNFEDPWFVLMTTSLIKGFRNEFPNCNINFFVSQESFSLLEYNRKIVAEIGYTTNPENSFDLAINFSPSLISANMLKNINSKVKKGFLESSQGLVFF
jgi:ADP-heptose:LPS heptosyltransferase